MKYSCDISLKMQPYKPFFEILYLKQSVVNYIVSSGRGHVDVLLLLYCLRYTLLSIVSLSMLFANVFLITSGDVTSIASTFNCVFEV